MLEKVEASQQMERGGVQADTNLTITRMAEIYGVSLRTLRFYEARNLLQPVRADNARSYTAKDRVRLELILKGKKLGFSLAEIETLIREHTPEFEILPSSADFTGTLSREEIRRQVEMLTERRDEVVAAIGDLQAAMDHLA